MSDALKTLRSEIDRIDETVVNLLNKRACLAQAIGEVKKANGEPLYSPERERGVLDRLRDLNKGPMSNQSVDKIYREIMSSALALEDASGLIAVGMSEMAAKNLAVYLSGNSASVSIVASVSAFAARRDLPRNLALMVPSALVPEWRGIVPAAHPDIRWAGCVQYDHGPDAGSVHLYRRGHDAAGHQRPAKAIVVPGAGSDLHEEAGWLSRLPLEYADRLASGAIILQFKSPVQDLNRKYGGVLSSCPATFHWIF